MEFANSVKHRQEMLQNFTDNQQEILMKYYKNYKKDALMTRIYQIDEDWQLIDFKINYNYRLVDDEAYNLYCECGKQLKYQYVIYSQKEDKVFKLGIEHFKQHLDIPQSIANQIQNHSYKLDSWLDYILVEKERFMHSLYFENKYYQCMERYFAIPGAKRTDYNKRLENRGNNRLTDKDLKMIEDFWEADIPVPETTLESIKDIIFMYEIELEKEKTAIEALKKRKEIEFEGAKSFTDKQKIKTRIKPPFYQESPPHPSKTQKLSIVNHFTKEKAKNLKKQIGRCRFTLVKEINRHGKMSVSDLYRQHKAEIDCLLESMPIEQVVIELLHSLQLHAGYSVSFDTEYFKLK